MYRKHTIQPAILLLTILLVLFSACSNPGKSHDSFAQEAADKKTVTFHHYFSGSMSGGINVMVDKLNSRLQTYQVKAVPIDHEAFKIRIIDALSSSSAADLYSYWAGAKTASIAKNLTSMDSVWQKAKLDEVFPKAIVDSACTYDNRKLMVPITQHFVGMVYNKRIFDELKLETPKSWDEFLQICEKIKKAGRTPLALGSKSKWPAQFWFDYILLRTTPYEYRKDLMAGKASYTDKEVENALEIWKQLLDKGYFNTDPNSIEWDSGAADMVYQGEAAMTLMGTWVIGYYGDERHKWALGKDYDLFEFPIINPAIPKCSLGPIDGIVIPAKAINKNEALETVVYFTQTEVQEAMSEGSGAFAPSSQVPDNFYAEPQARILKMIRQNPNWAFNYDLATPPEISEIGLTAFEDFLQFPAEYQSILKNAQSDIEKVSNFK